MIKHEYFCQAHGWGRCRCAARLNDAIQSHLYDLVSVETLARRAGMGEVEYAPRKPARDDS